MKLTLIRRSFGAALVLIILSQLSAAYLLSFFQKYLRAQDDHRLDGSSAEVPEILKILKK